MSPSVVDAANSYELSPDQHKIIYEGSLALEGQTPPVQVKEDLLRIHARNLELSNKSKHSNRQFVLPAAYSPSISSLDTLQKVL